MTRLPLALVGLLLALAASVASAQSYPQPYGMYGQGGPPGAIYSPYGAAPMYPGAMGPGAAGMAMPANGMYPDRASQAIYQAPAGNQASQPQMPLQRHSSGRAPQPKLPPGVHSENGVLYYDGKAYGDVNYQQNPNYNPYRQVAYEAAMKNGAGSAGPQSVMSQPGAYGVPPHAAVPDNGGPYGCPDDDREYDVYGRPRCRNQPFPGKYGYVWTAGFDVLSFTRDSGSERALVLDANSGATLFNSIDFAFNHDIGGKVFLSLMGPSGIQYQGTYMKLSTLIADHLTLGDNNLQIPPPLSADTVTFFDADSMRFRYTSEFQSAEANVLVPYGNFQILAGFRYIEIDELSALTSFDIDAGTGTFNANAFNNMYGGQIGVVGQWEAFGLVFFDFFAKFGVFENYAQEHQVLNDPINLRDTSGHHSEAAWMQDLGIQLVVPLGSAVSFHVGYEVFFFQQIALAPEQYDFNTGLVTDGTHVNNRGQIVMQGINLGLTAIW